MKLNKVLMKSQVRNKKVSTKTAIAVRSANNNDDTNDYLEDFVKCIIAPDEK